MSSIKRIRELLKKSYDRIKNERLKLNLLQAIPFWIGSLATGLIAVFYTKLFALTEQGMKYIFQHTAWTFFLLTPVCFIVAWWIVMRFAPYAKGSGIPQVMAAIELATPKHNEKVNKLLSLRIVIVKIVSSLIMHWVELCLR